MRGLKSACVGASLAIGTLLASAAGAATVYFTFTDSSGVAAHGQMTTTGGPNGVFGVDVTNLTGFVGASAITAFIADPNAPNQATSPDGLFYYDNNYDPATKSLDNAGLLFDVGATEYNLYNTGGGQYALYPATGGAYGTPDFGTFTTAVPEPAAWAMMIVGLGLTGAMIRRRPVVTPRPLQA